MIRTRRAKSVSTASASTASRDRGRSSAAASRHVPDGRGTFMELTVEENLRLGAYTRRDRAALARRFRARVRLFPAAAGALPPAGRHAVGRRAADAGDRARAAAAAEAAAARRAVVRPGAADRARDLRHPAPHQPRGRRMSILVVEQNASLALDHRRPRLPAGDRPHRHVRPGRARSAATRRCAAPISGTDSAEARAWNGLLHQIALRHRHGRRSTPRSRSRW